MKLLAPTGGKKNWNFEPIKRSGQEANPPFLTGSKVEDEKPQKWGYEEEKRWQKFVHGKDSNNIGKTKQYMFDDRNQDVFKFVDQFQPSLWERLKSNVLYLGKEITPRLMLTAFTTPLSNTKGAGGDQYIGDCEIPISLISSLGHDVGQQWFPIYRNDSYEQIAAPQKTGEICLIYTFSTSKKYVDIAVGGKKPGQKAVKPRSGKTNVVAKSAMQENSKVQDDPSFRQHTKNLMASQAALEKFNQELKERVEKQEKMVEDEKKRVETEKKKKSEAEKELTKTRKQLKDLEKKLQLAEKNSKIVTQTENNSNLPKFSNRHSSTLDEDLTLQMKEKDKALQEKEQYAKKMEDDKNKLEKEKQERDRQIAELMKKLKESEMERRKLSETREMERKRPSEKSKYKLWNPCRCEI